MIRSPDRRLTRPRVEAAPHASRGCSARGVVGTTRATSWPRSLAAAASATETYAYDDAGNRTVAPGRTFSYNAAGQLTACTGPACTVAYDDAGRISTLTLAVGSLADTTPIP